MTAPAKPVYPPRPADAASPRSSRGFWATMRRWWRRRVLGQSSVRSTRPSESQRSPEVDDGRPPSVDQMRRDLRELFGRVRGSRYVLRHLAVLEHTMKRKGDAAFEDLPLPVLRQAALQLESLIEPPVTVGVAALRSRLGMAVLSRDRMARADPTPIPPDAVTPVPTLPPRRAAGVTAAAAAAVASANAMADTQPAVLMRERISAYVAQGDVEISEASVSEYEKAVTDFAGLPVDIPLSLQKND